MFKPIVGEEREKFAGLMQPIADLKPGDKLQWKRGLRDARCPQYEEVVEVFSVINPVRFSNTAETGIQNHFHDFIILIRDDDGEIAEFGLDSRRFERVPE